MTDIQRFIACCLLLALTLPCLAQDRCKQSVPKLTAFYSQSWGIHPDNQRFQTADHTTINAANVASLRLKWAWGFPDSHPRSWPLVTEDTIFIGDGGKHLVALDRWTGCVRWSLRNRGVQIGTGIMYRRADDNVTLYYADRTAGLYAVDASTGKLLWHAVVKEPPLPLYSGTPLVSGNVLYLPISSREVAIATNPFYGCCTTSGGMAAFDATTGKELWYRPTISEPPRLTHRHWLLVRNYAPSGAPVWSSPTLDEQHGILYFGTGQNYSRPTGDTSDAIFALNASDGSIRWVRQFTHGDAYNLACTIPHDPNCTGARGPDLDFGAPPILVQTADGHSMLIAGQKAGDIYAMDPSTGATLWHRQIGRGGGLGGVHWGMAFNPRSGTLFVPISDMSAWPNPKPPAPGLFALDAATGQVLWSRQEEARCDKRICAPGLSAAIIATPDLVFAGSLDGYLRAYDASTGRVLWSYDTWKRRFNTVNGVRASGGAFDASGPMVAGDQVIVSSGYDQYGEQGGNALLVFQLEQKR